MKPDCISRGFGPVGTNGPTDTFDAVLAEMREWATRYESHGNVALATNLREYADRLAAAHAAEVAERDAKERESFQLYVDANEARIDAEARAEAAEERIAELEADKNAMFIRAREWATRSGEQEQRAEAAERDARELRAILYEAVGDDAKDWESGDGWPMGRFLVPALAGDYATAASEFAAYNAERAAIATTEAAP